MQLEKKLFNNIKVSMLGKYSLYGVQICSLMLLSRLFTPENFGEVIILQVAFLFFQVFTISGFSPAIIFLNKIDSVDRDGIFSFSIILGILMSLIYLIALIIFEKFFFENHGLEAFTYLFSISIIFSAGSMVPIASLQKDAKFISISICEIFSEILVVLVVVIFWCVNPDTGALAAKFILTPVFRFVFYYYKSKNTELGKPRLGSKVSAISLLWEFSKHQLIFNLFVYLSRNLDSILISKYFGSSSLAFYEKTYQVIRYPLQLFTFAINPALQPTLTKYRSNPALVGRTYYSVLVKLSSFGLFFSLLISTCSSEIVYILFGSQWEAVTPLLTIFSLTIPFQMLLSSTGGIYQSFGKTRLLLFTGVFSGTVNILAIILGVLSGNIINITKFLYVAYVINFFQCFIFLELYVFTTKKYSRVLYVFFTSLIPVICFYFFNIMDLFISVDLAPILSLIFYSILYSSISFFIYLLNGKFLIKHL